ncbi:MAG: hypothetical protein HYX32_15440 [Actinobacteria bacterium]|nr:hypothetical protein [Actinomycetota bacterium]
MQDTVRRIDSYELHPTPVAGTTTVEWRAPGSGRVVAVTDVAPRGRKGLWDAMARAATTGSQPATTFPTDAALAVEPVEVLPAPVLVLAPGIHQDGDPVGAHLDYLSRLSRPAATTETVAPVVSLADFAAKRRKSPRT